VYTQPAATIIPECAGNKTTTLELEEAPAKLYNFQLGVIIAGLYLVPVLIGLIGCFGAAQ
jgi:hypothetical protein